MGIVRRFLGRSLFNRVVEHTKKVHECVKLLDPLTEAFISGNRKQIEELHNLVSKTEHEADVIKDRVRDDINKVFLLSVNKQELKEFVRLQDSVADSVEDFSVILLLRTTVLPEQLKEDLLALVKKVIAVSERLLDIAEELSVLDELAFSGERAADVLKAIDQIGFEEWQADRLQRKFARHCYNLEKQMDPVTLSFLDKICSTLGQVANNAEGAGKHLRLVIGR